MYTLVKTPAYKIYETWGQCTLKLPHRPEILDFTRFFSIFAWPPPPPTYPQSEISSHFPKSTRLHNQRWKFGRRSSPHSADISPWRYRVHEIAKIGLRIQVPTPNVTKSMHLRKNCLCNYIWPVSNRPELSQNIKKLWVGNFFNFHPYISKTTTRQHTLSICMSFSIKSSTRNSNLKLKPETEVVLAYILTKKL